MSVLRCAGSAGVREMPLAEMPAAITGLAQQLRDGGFLRPERPAGRERAHATRMTPGEKARARRRATRMRRVEAVEPQPSRRHLIEHRRLHVRMAW